MNAEREPGSGDHLGHYQLVSAIGAGGMGRVWVALDTAAPALRLVALKTALRDSGNHQEFWALLSDEAMLASRIAHPNVCATHEFGDADGTHYLVMEWCDGTSLRDLLDAVPNHRLEPALAAHIVACVASGLQAAHELTGDDGQPLGVVHRDVSPQNILLTMRGHVRLADFGVAKARGQAHRATETGEVKGKLSYMSPEQVSSKNIDGRADVFALGCVLYEATLGVRPFHGNDALATMYKILEQDLCLPSQLDPAFPEGLERVIVKALTKSVNERYASAEELRVALLEYVAATRRPVSDKHTAELLEQSLGPTLRERNRAILLLADRLRKGETDPAKLRSPGPALPPAQRSVTPDGGIERSITQVVPVKVKARRAPFALLAVGVLAALGGLFFAWRADPPPTSNAAPSAELVPHAVAPPASVAPPAPSAPEALTAPALALSAASNSSSSAASASSSAARPSRTSPVHAAGVRRAVPAASVTPPVEVAAPKASARSPRPIDHSNPFVIP